MAGRDSMISRFASGASIAAVGFALLGSIVGGTWYASAKVTADAMADQYATSFENNVAEHFTRIDRRMDETETQLRKLMFMACTTPPLGRCTADGVPK